MAVHKGYNNLRKSIETVSIGLLYHRIHTSWYLTQKITFLFLAQKKGGGEGGNGRGWNQTKEHTTPGIRWSSPTQLLIRRYLAYLGESGRDPEFSRCYGRMWW